MSILQHEIYGGLARYADRVETDQNDDELVVSSGSASNVFHGLLTEADKDFQAGRFTSHSDALLNASQFAAAAAKRRGFDCLELAICDSGFAGMIGHTALGLSIRAKAQGLDLADYRRTIVVASRVANPHYLDYWRKYFQVYVVPEGVERELRDTLWPIVEQIGYVNTKNGPLHLYEAACIIERGWEDRDLPPLLTLTPQDHRRGLDALKKHGFTESDWFVALHVRFSPSDGPAYGRNARVRDYEEAIAAVTSEGGWVVRIGSPVMESLPGQERLIDLTLDPETPPWLDVFALAACRFLIGSSSGPSVVPTTFGVPVLMTNVTGLCTIPYLGKTLTLPKLVRPQGSTQALGMEQMLSLGVGWVDGFIPAGMNVDGRKLEWRDNTPSEIVDGVREMLNGTYSEDESAPQRDFESLMVSLGSFGVSRPCNSFLAKHWG